MIVLCSHFLTLRMMLHVHCVFFFCFYFVLQNHFLECHSKVTKNQNPCTNPNHKKCDHLNLKDVFTAPTIFFPFQTFFYKMFIFLFLGYSLLWTEYLKLNSFSFSFISNFIIIFSREKSIFDVVARSQINFYLCSIFHSNRMIKIKLEII